MSDFRDEFFGELFGNAADRAENFHRQLSFEHRAVKRIFSECGVKVSSMGRLVNICRDETGQPEFSFAWFNSFFRAFPARLCGGRITYLGKRADDSGQRSNLYLYQLTIAEALQNKNNKLTRAIFKALHNAAVNASIDDTQQPFIFMFSIVKTMFCAHNLDLPAELGATPSRAQLVVEYPEMTLRVERSATLFAAIGGSWYE